MNVMKSMIKALSEGKTLVMATIVEVKGDSAISTGSRLFIDDEGNRVGTIGSGAFEYMVLEKAKEVLYTKTPDLIRYDLADPRDDDAEPDTSETCSQVTVFYEPFLPKLELIIFGASTVGRAIVQKMQGTGFKIYLVDEIRTLGVDDVLGIKDAILIEDPMAAIDLIRPETYVVIATTNLESDYEILKAITELRLTPAFLGLMASSQKVATMKMRLLNETGLSPFQLRSPIGLDIGGASPNEIALAIAAQIQSIRYQKNIAKDMPL